MQCTCSSGGSVVHTGTTTCEPECGDAVAAVAEVNSCEAS
jgi:hypothetical protein